MKYLSSVVQESVNYVNKSTNVIVVMKCLMMLILVIVMKMIFVQSITVVLDSGYSMELMVIL